MAINPISTFQTVPVEILKKIYWLLDDFQSRGTFASVCSSWNVTSKAIEINAENLLIERKLRLESYHQFVNLHPNNPSRFANLVSFLNQCNPPSVDHPFFKEQLIKHPNLLCHNRWRFFYIKDPTTILGVDSQLCYPLYLKLEEHAQENVAVKTIACDGNFVFALCSNGKIIQWDYCCNNIVQTINTKFTDELEVKFRFFYLSFSNRHIILSCGKLSNDPSMAEIAWDIEIISLDSLDEKFPILSYKGYFLPRLRCFDQGHLYFQFGNILLIYNKENMCNKLKCSHFLLGKKWLFNLYNMKIYIMDKAPLLSIKVRLEFPPDFFNYIDYQIKYRASYKLFEFEEFLICITKIDCAQEIYFTIWHVGSEKCIYHERYLKPQQIIDILEPPKEQEITKPSVWQMVASIGEFCMSINLRGFY